MVKSARLYPLKHKSMIHPSFSESRARSPRSAQVKTGSWRLRAIWLLSILLVLAGNVSAQTAQWVKQMGTGGVSNGVSSDAAGNVYATGIVSNPGLFESIVIPCQVSDVFLTKYEASGSLLWATIGGGDLLDQANDIATDASGTSYVAGAIQTNSLHPTAQFGNVTLTGKGDYDWLLVKYDPAGNVVWAKNGGSSCRRHRLRRRPR